MDLSQMIAPKSDQLDSIDLVNGPRTFTVTRLSAGSDEQPLNIHFAEFPRPWRPGTNMRRVLSQVWGSDGTKYIGRRITLYRDPDVTFGKEKPGGTRISHMSHIDKPVSADVMLTRGRMGKWTVQPLPDAPAAPPVADRARQAVGAFERYGVGQVDLEERISKPLNEWDASDLDTLATYFKTMPAPTEVGEQA